MCAINENMEATRLTNKAKRDILLKIKAKTDTCIQNRKNVNHCVDLLTFCEVNYLVTISSVQIISKLTRKNVNHCVDLLTFCEVNYLVTISSVQCEI